MDYLNYCPKCNARYNPNMKQELEAEDRVFHEHVCHAPSTKNKNFPTLKTSLGDILRAKKMIPGR